MKEHKQTAISWEDLWLPVDFTLGQSIWAMASIANWPCHSQRAPVAPGFPGHSQATARMKGLEEEVLPEASLWGHVNFSKYRTTKLTHSSFPDISALQSPVNSPAQWHLGARGGLVRRSGFGGLSRCIPGRGAWAGGKQHGFWWRY